VQGGATLGLTNATLIITNTPASDGIRIVPAGIAIVQESVPNGQLDSGETVTVNLGLRNAGVLDAVRLGATLLSTNGIVALAGPSGSTSNYYGQLLAGGSTESLPYKFRVTATNGSRVTLNLRLQDGSLNLGTVTFDMFVGQVSFTFSNTAPIIINDFTNASPFPSAITVFGLNGTVSKVTATISNLSHTFPGDIDMMLVGPQGESVVLMSDAGSTSFNPNPINNVTLSFDDDLGIFLSETAQIVSGRYQPTNYGNLTQSDSWPAPIPLNAPSRSRLLTPGPNIDPNGIWQLFVVDDSRGDDGIIAGGWSVTIAMGGSGTSAADLGISSVASPNQTTPGQNVDYTISVTNYGPALATGILVSNVLDPSMTFVSSQGNYTVSGNVVRVTLPNLASGAGANIVMTARANPANTTVTNTLFNLATVQASETDLNPGNNRAISKVIVYPPPPVSVSRKAGQLVLSWPAPGGANFVVECTVTLVPVNWVPINTIPTLSGGTMSVTINPTNQVRFYRIRPQ
jgi:uncharacterized repeat protein (TIGR01451 family)